MALHTNSLQMDKTKNHHHRLIPFAFIATIVVVVFAATISVYLVSRAVSVGLNVARAKIQHHTSPNHVYENTKHRNRLLDVVDEDNGHRIEWEKW